MPPPHSILKRSGVFLAVALTFFIPVLSTSASANGLETICPTGSSEFKKTDDYAICQVLVTNSKYRQTEQKTVNLPAGITQVSLALIGGGGGGYLIHDGTTETEGEISKRVRAGILASSGGNAGSVAAKHEELDSPTESPSVMEIIVGYGDGGRYEIVSPGTPTIVPTPPRDAHASSVTFTGALSSWGELVASGGTNASAPTANGGNWDQKGGDGKTGDGTSATQSNSNTTEIAGGDGYSNFDDLIEQTGGPEWDMPLPSGSFTNTVRGGGAGTPEGWTPRGYGAGGNGFSDNEGAISLSDGMAGVFVMRFWIDLTFVPDEGDGEEGDGTDDSANGESLPETGAPGYLNYALFTAIALTLLGVVLSSKLRHKN